MRGQVHQTGNRTASLIGAKRINGLMLSKIVLFLGFVLHPVFTPASPRCPHHDGILCATTREKCVNSYRSTVRASELPSISTAVKCDGYMDGRKRKEKERKESSLRTPEASDKILQRTCRCLRNLQARESYTTLRRCNCVPGGNQN